MERLRNILLAMAALLFAGLSAGCVYDNYNEDYIPSDVELVTLRIDVGTLGTRAGIASDAKEQINTLRVVLLNAAGQIEYNNHYTQGTLEDASYVKADEAKLFFRTQYGPKKIFLIANEDCTNGVSGGFASLTAALDSKKVGDDGFEEFVNGLTFTPDFEKGLVLTSAYEFTVSGADDHDKDKPEAIKKEFFLVHVATKFELRFVNDREHPVTIDALSISSLAGDNAAGDMYLMANFGPTSNLTKTGPDGRFWIDWLADVSEETTNKPELPDNEGVNSDYDWITDYNLPSDVHNDVDVMALLPQHNNWTIPTGGESQKITLPIFYASESKYNVGADNFQNYTFSITLTDTDPERVDDPLRTHVFTPETYPDLCRFANLHTLFRNTHVILTVRVSGAPEDMELHLLIGICPWYEQTIDIPTFD